MTEQLHKVILSSTRHYGTRLPTRSVGVLLAELFQAVRYASSMAIRNRSPQKGEGPAWLHRVTDIRFVDMQGNLDSTLYFECPSLGEAAPELYTQRDLGWTPPSAEDSGFDLLGDILVDVEAANADSERFDRPMLKRLLRFREVFRRGFSQVHIESRRYQPGRPAHLTLPILQTAERFLAETSPSRRVRVVGKLDRVNATNQTFALKLGIGEEVRGVLPEGNIEELARLLNKQVLTFGRALFRPSGRLLRIDVDEFRLAGDADQFFAKAPEPMQSTRRRLTLHEREKNAEGLRAVIGKWPGDETEEQIRDALEELS